MNNMYLFRAKAIDSDTWVQGSYVYLNKITGMVYKKQKAEHFIVQENGAMIIVNPETICQHTGLRNFFDRDIVMRNDKRNAEEPKVGIIEYDNENTAFLIHWIDNEKYSPMYPWKDKIEVIGNLFDNFDNLEIQETRKWSGRKQ